MEGYQLLAILLIVLWISLSVWAVKDISKILTNRRKRQQKVLWTNLVVIFPFMGLLIYLLMGRKLISRNAQDVLSQ